MGEMHCFPEETICIIGWVLATKHNVSLYAARHAVEMLAHRGFIECRHGSGTYVAKKWQVRKIGIVIPGLAYSSFFRPFADRMVQLCTKSKYKPVIREDWYNSSLKRAKEVLNFVRDLIEETVSGVVFQPLEHFPKADYANRKIAAAAFRALVGRIALPSLPPCEIYLPAPLVVRDSTRR